MWTRSRPSRIACRTLVPCDGGLAGLEAARARIIPGSGCKVTICDLRFSVSLLVSLKQNRSGKRSGTRAEPTRNTMRVCVPRAERLASGTGSGEAFQYARRTNVEHYAGKRSTPQPEKRRGIARRGGLPPQVAFQVRIDRQSRFVLHSLVLSSNSEE